MSELTKSISDPDMKSTGSGSGIPSGGIWGNVLVVAFLALLLGLSIRSQIVKESRFGWGMFSRNIEYTIHYEWVYADGSRKSYIPGKELKGKALQLTRKKGGARKGFRNTRYDIGTIRRWIHSYLAYLYKNAKPDEAVAIEAKFYFALNQLKSDPTPPKLEIIRHP